MDFLQGELDNLTWHEVQRRIRDVQSEQQMCIHKEQLTELDIYHRILRWDFLFNSPWGFSQYSNANFILRFL